MLYVIMSYLVGSISGSYILGNLLLKKDVRKYGSGNAGTTNAIRSFGKKIGIFTFIIDFFKGVLMMAFLKYILNLSEDLLYICSFALIIGHDYPFYMNFKGGKGVATTVGSLSILNFYIDLISVFGWILIVFITKTVSLASILYFIIVSILFIIFNDLSIIQTIMILCIGALGILRHKDNIKRILKGTENKIGQNKK